MLLSHKMLTRDFDDVLLRYWQYWSSFETGFCA